MKARCLAVTGLLVLALPGAVLGQGRGPTRFSISAGGSDYSLDGTGRTWVAAIRTDVPAARWLIVEPGFTYLSYRTQFNTRVNYLMPELSLQFQARFSGVRPYLGGGIGFTSYTSGPNNNELTLHAVGGVRFDLRNSLGLRAEFRLRSVDPWFGRTADATVGLSWITLGGR